MAKRYFEADLNIDLGLHVLSIVSRDQDLPGPFSRELIAEVCDCSPERIRQIECSALYKICRDPALLAQLDGHIEIRDARPFKLRPARLRNYVRNA